MGVDMEMNTGVDTGATDSDNAVLLPRADCVEVWEEGGAVDTTYPS
jgi:hypothetical protein